MQLDFPTGPTPGQVYSAPNGVDYIWDNSVGTGVWLATIATSLSITNPGSISGSAQVNGSLTYALGTATGGTAPYGYSWIWRLESDGSQVVGTVADQDPITVPASALNDRIYVELTVTDSASNTATADTAPFPTPPAVIGPAGITNAVAPTTIPGTANFTWADAAGNLTSNGCLEFSVDGGGTWGQGPQAVTGGTNVLTRWEDQTPGACGQLPTGTLNGCLISSTGLQSCFTFVIDRVPNGFTLSPNTESTTPLTVTTANPTVTFAGTNAPSLIWGSLAGGGSNAQYSINSGVTWVNLPTTPNIANVVNPGTAVEFRFTTSSANGTEVLTVNAGASTTVGQFQSGIFTVTVATAPFPSSLFSPSGAPNASPASVNIPADSLYGTATCASWADGSTTLTSTGGILFEVNGVGGFTDGPTPINDTNSIAVIWDPTVISTALDGATLNGTLTNGAYTNTYSITIDRAVEPTSFLFTDIDPGSYSTQETSNVVTPSGFNVPVNFTIAGTGSDPLTSIGSQVATGGFSSAAKVVNPGETVQLQGTTGAANSTVYGIVATIGSPSISDTWTVKTPSASPYVSTPSIVTPSNGATGQGTPTGITITSSAYSSGNGAGGHASSDWELYANSYPLTSTNSITVTATVSPNWVTQTSGFGTAGISGIAYGGGTYVIVGNRMTSTGPGNVSTSTNGTTWTNRWSAVFGTGLNGVVYGNSQFVACGNNGVIVTSPTGVTWTSRTNPLSGALQSVAYNGSNLYVVAGNGGVMATSADAITWTARTSSFGATNITGVAYGNSIWVAVGDTGTLATSTNGTTWTQQTSSFGTTNISGVKFVNGLFFAGGVGKIATSTDGINWTQRTVSGFSAGFGVNSFSYGNGQYVAVGQGSGTVSEVATSPDGVTWTLQTAPGTNSLRDILYQGGTFITVGNVAGLFTGTQPSSFSTLTIAGCQTDGFLVGDSVVSDPGAAASGVIYSLDNTQVVTSPSNASWAAGQFLKRAPSSYTLTSSATADTVNLVSWPVAKPPLAANTTYYTRVRYTSGPTVTTSSYSGWSKFTTGSLLPAIGDLYGGGYFAGQINDGGTIYNLVVAPVEGNTTGPVTGGALKGQYGGATPVQISWKTTSSSDTPSATVQNQVYGGPTTDLLKASAVHPVFNTFINGATGPNAGAFNLTTGGAGGGTGIGGYNDWYLPAKNELEILYYYLKPNLSSSQNNDTGSGSNANAVAPEPVSTNYTALKPSRTTATLFQGTNAQAFATQAYWSATESTGTTTSAWRQGFMDGLQIVGTKANTLRARAIRRVAA